MQRVKLTRDEFSEMYKDEIQNMSFYIDNSWFKVLDDGKISVPKKLIPDNYIKHYERGENFELPKISVFDNIQNLRTFDGVDVTNEGSWKKVFKARHIESNTDWVLKFISPNKKQIEQAEMRMFSDNVYELLRKETLSRYWQNIPFSNFDPNNESNVAYSTLFLSDDGTPYIAEEYMPVSLEDLLRHNFELDLKSNLKILYSIANAFEEIHTKTYDKKLYSYMSSLGIELKEIGRMLGEIKLVTVRINKNDIIKVCDNGTSVSLDDDDNENYPWIDNSSIGDVHPQSPENFKPYAKPSVQRDFYNFGMELFRFLSKREAIFKNLFNELGEKRFKQHLIDIDPREFNLYVEQQINKYVPPEFREILINSTKYEPNERYKNSTELKEAIQQIIHKNHLSLEQITQTEILNPFLNSYSRQS